MYQYCGVGVVRGEEGPIFCFGVLICLSRGQRMSLFFARALLLIPVHLGNSPLFFFFFLKSPFFLSSIPPLLPNTYPTLFCPSCPLARSEVETCVSLHLHGRERKKSEVRSLSPPLHFLILPSLPSPQRRADRLAPSMELSLTPGR